MGESICKSAVVWKQNDFWYLLIALLIVFR